MKKSHDTFPLRRDRFGIVLVLSLLGAGLVSSSWREATAVEPAREFLNALRDRGYHDVALDYLEMMETSSLAPAELKEIIQYEKAVTLIEGSRAQRDQAIRAKYLDDAQQLLKEFTDNPRTAQHALANSARSQLGNLIVERARMKVEQSKKGDKAKLLQEANALYEEAYKVFKEMEETVRVQLDRIPKVLDLKDKRQAAMAERRNQLRADYLQTQLTAAAIREEMADTVPEGSEPFKALLTEAASQYDEIYKKYRTRLAGLYARLYQGRANQRIGKLQDALGYYSELLDQPDEPEAFRLLKTKTLRLAMDGWLHPSEKKYVEAIKRGADWVKKSRPTDDRDPDWLAIRLSLAKAYKMQADEAETGDTRTISQSTSEAKKQANFVANKSSEFQEEARQLVAALGGPDRTGDKPEPRTFDEAKTAGKEALDSIQTASLVVSQVPARLAKEKDETVKADLQKQLEEAQGILATARDDAMMYYQLALRLVNDETSIDDVNIVRYFLCYLYYLEQDYYKAALMGEFVAQRYPDSAGARQSAKIAMACYIQVYGETNQMAGALFKELDKDTNGAIAGEELTALPEIAQGADKNADEEVTRAELDDRLVEFDVAHIVAIAEYIADKWSDQPEAEEALNTLVPFMINAGELDRAQQFLNRIPESSPKRGDSELKTGQAMWGTYLRGSQQLQQWEADGPPADVDVAAKREELNNLTARAVEILSAGYGRLQATTKPTRAIVTALLSLAQADLETQQAAKAVEVLENATFGPLVLVNKKDPSATDPAVVEEVYKTALRAYISLLGGAEGSGAIDKAKDVMDKMKAAIGGDAEGEKRLISVYVNLAQDLEKQLESATPEVKRALSLGFETFLRQLNEGATELSVLNWVAESFSKLGKSLDDGQTLNEDAKKYYQASLDAFQNILDKVKLEPNMKVQVQLRMASVQGEMRDFERAVGTFESVLQANANALNVQVEAAKLIELWGKQPGQEEKYKAAIVGIRKEGEPKPVIWGWGGISQKTAGNPKFKETFYEARLHLAQCRYDHAMRLEGADKDKLLNAAKQDISITKKLYPELGGEQMKPKYDSLVKKIQNALGEQVTGLDGL
ncbi:MAG: hypothetical protein O3C40_37180 [Planctomycetota bacterium]|nr:hypothetical protein [Planctomycetota bacterium]